ncbi:MAG: N-6 DNA methylase [Thermoleophilia bacterium]
MLDTDTKRRIDTARDILVGKVPDPKSQVEQITIALIYKFMDDMDAEAEELGGRRKFFAEEFARYGWAKLMRSGLGGHETLNLYAEAIAKMPENPGIPLLFRDIFKNAYLPYRDPETLRAFLKIIDEFTYDHSEKLGDAFEYLLSVLGSQGDAGQFRTPRHIIDFMVAIVDPKKTETVLDPACGTAGFLISSWKHILQANTDAAGNSTLTPDDRGRLAQNFTGYDISPDMVRLSLVNMYLHGFADPHIAEYDTLTSQDKWNEHADVILANPPFMSPKGGIKPHNRFSVQSKRSEVLFVDYMAEHLTPGGRAGIIVPEGIIFQSQNAYKQLRKMLVEEYLVAVVSLPAGVFQPYSGVKTSILILDKSLARRGDTIAFFKVENDGYGLGAQRREIGKNDLPQVHAEIGEYLGRLRARELVEDFAPTLGQVVPKEKIAANGDYNLSGERYREGVVGQTRIPMVPLGEVAELIRGITFGKSEQLHHATGDSLLVATTKAAQSSGIVEDDLYRVPRTVLKDEAKLLRAGDILISTANSLNLLGRTTHVLKVDRPTSFGAFMSLIRANGRILDRYLIHCLRTAYAADFFLRNANTTTNISNLNLSALAAFQIPLPPLEVQKEIVAEIEGYQKVIDGARAVIENYRPHIPIHPDWPMATVEDLAADVRHSLKAGPFGSALKKESYVTSGYKIYGQEQVIRGNAEYGDYYVSKEKYREPDAQAPKARLRPRCARVIGNNVSAPEAPWTGVRH